MHTVSAINCSFPVSWIADLLLAFGVSPKFGFRVVMDLAVSDFLDIPESDWGDQEGILQMTLH
jgi:hypothetical protein